MQQEEEEEGKEATLQELKAKLLRRAERLEQEEVEDPVMRAGIAELKRLIYLNRVLRIKKMIDEERMKLESSFSRISR